MNEEISIRAAVPKDADAIASLVLAVHEENPDEWVRDEQLTEKLRKLLIMLEKEPHLPAFVFVAESEGGIVGSTDCSTSLRVEQRSESQLSNEVAVFVAREYRRRGIAEDLLSKVIDAAKAHPNVGRLEAFIMETNRGSLALVDSVGFRLDEEFIPRQKTIRGKEVLSRLYVLDLT